MIRNIKALGLALVAVFAMSAMAASAAQAAEFTAAEYPATITATPDGTGKQVFTSGPLGGKVRCNTVSGTSTLAGASTEMLAEEIEYTGECKALGLLPATIHMNGCKYRFTVSGSVHIECPTGASITVVIYQFGTTPAEHGNPEKVTEVIHLGSQTVNGITYHNIETADGTMHVTVEAHVEEEIEATYTGSLYEGSSTTDSYEGKFIASAKNEFGEAIDTTVE